MLKYKIKNNWHLINVKNNINIVYDRIRVPINLDIISEQLALIVNLNCPENIIKRGFQSTTKNKINKSLKANLVCKYIDHPTETDINDFVLQFRNFASDKNSQIMKNVVGDVEVFTNEASKEDVFIISICSSSDYPNLKIYHSHLIDKYNKTARLINSCSSYRNIDKNLQKIVASMNRYLHYQDFLYFKNLGYDYYDLGGISFTHNLDITNFKLGFSSKIIKYYYAKNKETFFSKKKQIVILYDDEVYEQALSFINQLALDFDFLLFKKDSFSRKMYKKYNVIDLTNYKNYIDENIFGFNPLDFYFINERFGNLQIGTDENCKNIKTNKDLNKYLNSIDVFVSNNPLSIVKALACGCYVITDKCKQYTESDDLAFLVDDINNKAIIESICNKNIKKIRNNAYTNSIKSLKLYSDYYMYDKYKNFVLNKLKKSFFNLFNLKNYKK